ncbi:DNA mismatch repair protein Msh2 [Achlya hypogyna]|uniref:DNA mismatch repair protein Msh2 n=1 Tax=Achlya hypogyna TaxID=1202772 RepID=A0A1V9ZGN0_ACHHY|nr:DNA mismatch repair protein Msh2 [Achlya hypogyna]
MDATQDETYEEVAAHVLMAIVVRAKKQQNEVGVAVRRPRARNSCVRNAADEDKNQWELVLYSFADCNQLSTLDNLFVQVGPTEVLVSDGATDSETKTMRQLLQAHSIERRIVPRGQFKCMPSVMEANLCRLLGVTSVQASHRAELEMELAMNALAGLLEAESVLTDADGFGTYSLAVGDMDSFLQLDRAALTALNLLPDPLLTGNVAIQNGSILELLNKGKTTMGRRLLERWIRMPLVDATAISARQDVVELFVDESSLRMELLDECMKSMPDLEKLARTLDKQKYVKLDALVAVYDAAKYVFPRVYESVRHHDRLEASFTVPLKKVLDDISGYVGLIEELVDFSSRPHVTVNAKHDPELMALRTSMKELEADIEEEHFRAREDIGGDIKCEKDKARGFVFRIIDKKQEERVSKVKDVHICQVLTNGFYFVTHKLKSLAKAHGELAKEYEARQAHILTAAIEVAATYVPVVESAAKLMATLDVLLGFGHVASHANYTRPVLGTSAVALENARHPCVELQDGVEFIPNNIEMEAATSRFQLLTGPNMGGKSTYIRSLGAIAVMAQIGSFVPATSAMLPIMDRLLVRVGAGDMQQRGVSTFMLEMLEAAVICKKATDRSLVIIDELGRGTSTYDGFGLAWAISEHLLARGCWCVFATHFHELTALASGKSFPGIVNKHVTAHKMDDKIAMVYEVRDGPCLESFGIYVAEMAGFPADVVAHAKRKARELEHFEMPNPAKKARNNPVAFRADFAALPLGSMSDADVLAAVTKLLD